jgi:hypothetical protein
MMAGPRDTSAARGPHTIIYSFIPPPTAAEAVTLARFAGTMDDELATPEPGTRFSYDADLKTVRVTFDAGLRIIAVDALAELYLLGALRIMGRSGSVRTFRCGLGEIVAVEDRLIDDQWSLNRWHARKDGALVPILSLASGLS